MKIIDVNLTIGGKDSIGKNMDLPYLLELMAVIAFSLSQGAFVGMFLK